VIQLTGDTQVVQTQLALED